MDLCGYPSAEWAVFMMSGRTQWQKVSTQPPRGEAAAKTTTTIDVDWGGSNRCCRNNRYFARHGANLTTINFLGETDFHVMGASYYGEAVYVLNPSPNSLLSTGLHYSLDGGETWEGSEARGLAAAPIQIAVHPSEVGVVAAATQGGVFLSNDFGGTFTRIGQAGVVTSVTFDPDGERLLFGFDSLFWYTLSDGQITALPVSPQVDADQAILYIAINPVSDEMAIATSDRDVFYSPNGGQSWEQIAADGTGG